MEREKEIEETIMKYKGDIQRMDEKIKTLMAKKAHAENHIKNLEVELRATQKDG